jgi:hypothetical protein
MRNALFVFVSALVSIVFSQPYQNSGFSGYFGVLDQYYGDILFRGNDQKLLSDKINYPGLIEDSTFSCGLGFFNPYSAYYDQNGLAYQAPLTWSNLYGWNEWATEAGRLGAWIGGIDFSDQKNNYGTEQTSRSFEGTTAFWFSPYKASTFKGLSLVLNGYYNSDLSNTYSNDGSFYSYDTTKNTYKILNAAVSSIFKINDIFNLKLFFAGGYRYNIQNSIYEYYYSYPISTDYYPYYYSEPTTSTSLSQSEYKTNNLFLRVGLIDKNDRQVNLGFSVDASNNTYSSYYYNAYGSGDYSVFLNYSEGKRVQYLRHYAYFGVIAQTSLDFPVESNSYIGLSKVLQMARLSQRYWYGSLNFPVILDVNLFNTPLYAIVRVVPEISGSESKYPETYSNRYVGLSVSEVSLGLRGKIGDQLEFALVPSLKNDIFVSGLEIKYLFKNKKMKSKKIPDTGITEEKEKK